MWPDGSAPAYTNWGPNEPNDSSGEDCASLSRSSGETWNDLDCDDNNKPYICVAP